MGAGPGAVATEVLLQPSGQCVVNLCAEVASSLPPSLFLSHTLLAHESPCYGSGASFVRYSSHTLPSCCRSEEGALKTKGNYNEMYMLTVNVFARPLRRRRANTKWTCTSCGSWGACGACSGGSTGCRWRDAPSACGCGRPRQRRRGGRRPGARGARSWSRATAPAERRWLRPPPARRLL
eukprot:5756381-Pyramimonas_sp.AAC.2